MLLTVGAHVMEVTLGDRSVTCDGELVMGNL